ncbi:MAG: hypothetical protein C0599_13245 [Salinivirgaceae bacterium]|nr:MAG: hypothetical protein C0599_13245 [Salinivirgaceae bacterium]
MKVVKIILIWVAAIVITLSAAIYQRMTGPTYPLRFKTEVNGEAYKFKLTRSASIGKGCTVEIPANENVAKAKIVYRKYPGNFKYDTLSMNKDTATWNVQLPVQPAAAKLEYFALLYNENGKLLFENSDNTAIVRFKGDVPAIVLTPHIILMFLAMLFSTAAMLMAVFKFGNFRLTSFVTLGLLAVGGLILGPIVQHYAFGEAWTGWPYGKDLTDNKTLITAIFWIGAVVLNIKKPRRWAVIIAAVVLLAVYSIPHSARGSEFDHKSGEIVTG